METYTLPTHGSAASSEAWPPAPHMPGSGPLPGPMAGLQGFPESLHIDTYNGSTVGSHPSVTSSTSGPGGHARVQSSPAQGPAAAKVQPARDPRDALIDELSDMALAQPPVAFADRYLLLDERVEVRCSA